MKMIKLSAMVLLSGLFFASCGDGANNDETPVDTMQMETPPMEEAAPMPDTVNGIDTTVDVGGRDNTTSMRENGSAQSGGRTATNNSNVGDENSTNTSTSGKPTENPAKSPSTGNPGRAPERKAGSSPNM